MDLSQIFLTEPLIIDAEVELAELDFKTLKVIPIDTPNRNASIFTRKATVAVTGETRKEAFDHIVGTLGERQRIVMEKLKGQFPDGATAKELSNHLYANRLAPSPERNSVHPRLNELVEQGLVEVIGKKTCQFTNRKVAVYKSKI